jgi:hypothetical protein
VNSDGLWAALLRILAIMNIRFAVFDGMASPADKSNWVSPLPFAPNLNLIIFSISAAPIRTISIADFPGIALLSFGLLALF